MAYAIWDTATNQIVKGPVGSLPGRMDWGDGSQVSPAKVGMTNGDLMIVEVIDTDRPPTRWHTDTGERSYSLSGSTLTVTRTFAKTKAPTAAMVKGEAERRAESRYSASEQSLAIMQYIRLLRKGANRTAQEESRLDSIETGFQWIASVFKAADTISALDPIPYDFEDDKRWPA